MSRFGALDALGAVSVHPTPEDVARAAAEHILEASQTAVSRRDMFSVALAGGSTPRLLYRLLAGEEWRHRMRWAAWRVHFGDERAVSPDDEHSNHHLAATELLRHVPVDDAHVHRMQAERRDLDAAAADYHRLLEDTLPPDADGIPQLDLILLGLGENGHTASLFPGTPALEVVDMWATRGRADSAPYDRITLTFPVLNAAATVLFMVTGTAKHEAVGATAAGRTPASRVQPVSGPATWLLDRAAAAGDRSPS